MFAWPLHFVAFDGCWWIWESDSILSEIHTGDSVLALGSKNAGRNSNEDVVLSTDHVVLLANGFPRLIIYVRPPSLFQEQVA